MQPSVTGRMAGQLLNDDRNVELIGTAQRIVPHRRILLIVLVGENPARDAQRQSRTTLRQIEQLDRDQVGGRLAADVERSKR